jgi:hypothetical protein
LRAIGALLAELRAALSISGSAHALLEKEAPVVCATGADRL